jgi:hypothetical protein
MLAQYAVRNPEIKIKANKILMLLSFEFIFTYKNYFQQYLSA